MTTPPADPPATLLLRALGPVTTFHDPEVVGAFGMAARAPMGDILAPDAEAGRNSRLGPLENVHVFWFAGASCDGCTVAVTGSQSPSVESLVMGAVPGLPRLVLHHPVVNVESGPAYLLAQEQALQGMLGAPYIVVVEGSLSDEAGAAGLGGYWSGQGEEPWGPAGAARDVTAAEWVARLAPGAAAVVAIGTCATWGGIPAAAGNPTGAMGVGDFLGAEYRSALGLPVVNVPGCAPVGDNFTETAAALLAFLQGYGPLPEIDELGRPSWLYGETVHHQCGRAAYYAEDSLAEQFGDKECVVDLGCWGPVVQCNMPSRGAINGVGGCTAVGGACIGCTMPGFPDSFVPFYTKPPADVAAGARLRQGVIKPLRRYSESRPGALGTVPSGWADTSVDHLRGIDGHRFYDRIRRSRTATRRTR